eukprot:CAMPEP_0113669400 /NCGR_PEP_ID=MMETSP0038_2-20120614/4551_1 /TAXON_ID=2898 /ORGANISM="Cryptomonas paramecium" /LENGTH=228 /DNA_ID=CAMNT_0000585283 /DNA_START=214 /DNA_END=897 /DNA_ORIENTATION=+ /assembly_acc=CAM_ASM_000170
MSFTSFVHFGILNSTQYRFTPVFENQSLREVNAQVVLSLQILDNKCNTQVENKSERQNITIPGTSEILMDNSSSAYGFRLVPLVGNGSLTFSFSLLALDDDMRWTPVAATSFVKQASGIELSDGGPIAIGPSGIDFDRRVDWPLTFPTVWTRIALGSVFIAVALSAPNFGEAAARRIAGSGLLLVASLHLTTFLGFAVLRSYAQAAVPAAYALVAGIIGTLVVAAPAY